MNPIKFLATVNTLKRIPRSGWITHGVSLQDVESVADHTFSTCVISLLLADLEQRRGVRVNVERVLRTATLHDLAEALTFDISRSYLTYLGKRGSAIKNEIETSAWKYLARSIGSPRLSNDYLRLQEQYVSNNTIEAQIVHAADGIDILLQILELRRRGYPAESVKDLWGETVKRLKETPIRSAKDLLKRITKEGRHATR
ncbi:MAG: HD family hydrolase [Candidatus Bathyarchaeia archaeon]|jgi:putative hydrolase of HD superfamily